MVYWDSRFLPTEIRNIHATSVALDLDAWARSLESFTHLSTGVGYNGSTLPGLDYGETIAHR